MFVTGQPDTNCSKAAG